MDSCMFIHLSTILLFLLLTAKGRSSLGHLQERWVSEVLKRTLPTQHKWLPKIVLRVAFDLGLRKVKGICEGPG